VTGQDLYLAASIILILSTLTVIGTLIADLLLAWLDPRIRFEKAAT
jgi:peptide/nickel transport system permease protein